MNNLQNGIPILTNRYTHAKWTKIVTKKCMELCGYWTRTVAIAICIAKCNIHIMNLRIVYPLTSVSV